jgi:outer membrane protein assembly factor BamB
MRTPAFLLAVAVCGLFPQAKTFAQSARVDDRIAVTESDWPWWRGTMRNGTANPGQVVPTEFSESLNVRWKADVPGRGYGSPSVVGNHVFLATADQASGSQSVICFDRSTGQQLWHRIIHESGGMLKNSKSTAASSTPACDGERVFINFPNSGALFTTALGLDGKILWQTKISDYVIHQGYGASPAIYQDLVIVSADNKGGGAIAGLRRDSGEIIWRRDRPALPNYPSPIILNAAGKDQVIMVGCDLIVSYDPLTGTTNWETVGATTECVTSTVTDGRLVYTSGGYPTNHMSAIAADGSAEKVWANGERLYVPSLVIRDGYLYGILDAGIAICWEAASGKEMWKARVGGTFSASPVLVGDRIFISNEAGEFFIFEARPDRYSQLAKNRLGDLVMATPAICGGAIYHRVTYVGDDGSQHEALFCIAETQSR